MYRSFKKKPFSMVHKFKRSEYKTLRHCAPNRVLKVVIQDYQIEITTFSLYYVFSYYGLVLRIVIFSQNGQKCAMVEYDSIEAASRARDYLNNFRMFYTCNKLKVEYSWTHQLDVIRNDEMKSWDFTRQPYCSDQAPALYNSYGCTDCSTEAPYYPQQQSNMQYNTSYGVNMSSQQPQITFSPTPLYNEMNVVIVDGLLMECTNPDKLFNLMSIYGNVNRIQFMENREGIALVQMFDTMSADNCVRFLNNAPIGVHGQISVLWAPQTCAPCSFKSFTMPDGSASYKDFSESKNQRFLLPRPSYWIQPLSRVLRFYNMPSSVDAEFVFEIFRSHFVVPMNVKVLPLDEDTRLARGLVEFSSLGFAVLAIMKCNNKEVKLTTSSSTFYLKLCFSSSQSIDLKH